MKEEDKPKLSFPKSTLNRLVEKEQRRENMEGTRERAMCLSCEGLAFAKT